MTPKSEQLMKIITIEYGHDEFNLVGDTNCTIFQFKSRNKILAWEMNWGTLVNFFAGTIHEHPIFFWEAYGALQEKLTTGEVSEKNLELLISPFLTSFSSGKYGVELTDQYCDFEMYYPRSSRCSLSGELIVVNSKLAFLYPPFLIAIQESTDRLTVDNYREQILNGKRPQAIVLKTENSDLHFILDGHHKIQAYFELSVKPNLVLITKLDNYKISHELILEAYDRIVRHQGQKGREALVYHLGSL